MFNEFVMTDQFAGFTQKMQKGTLFKNKIELSDSDLMISSVGNTHDMQISCVN